jgi:hypothetical protein
MTFADLRIGDHFIWPPDRNNFPESVNINIKIAWSDDGGGFAIDLATRKDCVPPATPPKPEDSPGWIPGMTSVIKLNGAV